MKVSACLRCAKGNMGKGSVQIWANILKGKQGAPRTRGGENKAEKTPDKVTAQESDFRLISSGTSP